MPGWPTKDGYSCCRISRDNKLETFDNTPTIGTNEHRPTELCESFTITASEDSPTAKPSVVLFGEESAPVLQLVTASEQQPTLFSFDVKGFVVWGRSEVRKFLAFASAAITIRDFLIQVVQHTPRPERSNNPWVDTQVPRAELDHITKPAWVVRSVVAYASAKAVKATRNFGRSTRDSVWELAFLEFATAYERHAKACE